MAAASAAGGAGGADGVESALRGVRVVICQVVTGSPAGDVSYQLRIDDGRMEIGPGGREGSDVVVVVDYEAAAAISRGDLNPATALAAGRLRLGGDIGLMMAHREAFAEATTSVFAGVRAATTY